MKTWIVLVSMLAASSAMAQSAGTSNGPSCEAVSANVKSQRNSCEDYGATLGAQWQDDLKKLSQANDALLDARKQLGILQQTLGILDHQQDEEEDEADGTKAVTAPTATDPAH